MTLPLPQVPLLTIVVPVLDEAPGIAAALAPLQGLRAEGVELVVVDGGSVDDTVARAKALCDRVIFAPRGRGRQMHQGACAARGDVLLFLHADTMLPEGAVAAIRRAVHGGAAWGRFDVMISGDSPMLRIVAFMMNWRSRLTGIATGDQAIFVTRTTYFAAGGFPDIPLMEDIAFTGALRRRHRPASLRERVVTSGRRWERHGVLRTVPRMWALRLRYFFGVDPRQLAIDYGYRPRDEAPAGVVRVAILAKAPLPGHAKTRLIPRLGAEGAASFQRWLLRRTLATVHAASLGPVVLWCAPDCSDPVFAALARSHPGLELHAQPAADLGERMAAAVRQTPAMPTLVVGTDCPWFAPADFAEAATALAANDAVLVPAEDGGYVLIGLAAPHDAPFGQLPWGSDTVLMQTREALSAAGLSWVELSPRPDVDRPEDLGRLFADFPEACEAIGANAAVELAGTTSKKNGSTPPEACGRQTA